MSIVVNGHEIGQLIASGIWIGSIVAAAIVIGIVYLMVRPPRHVRRPPPRALDRETAAEMAELVERMEARMAVLERLLVERAERQDRDQRNLAPAGDGRDSGRKE
jgi:hypothetical protein